MNGRTFWQLMTGAAILVATVTAAHAREPMTPTLLARVAGVKALPAAGSSSQSSVDRVIQHLRAGQLEAAAHAWTLVCDAMVAGGQAQSLDPILYWVVRNAYLLTVPELGRAAEQAWFRSEQTRAAGKVLATLRQARDSLARQQDPAATARIPCVELTTVFRPGAVPVVERSARNLSRMLVDAEILMWDQKRTRAIATERVALEELAGAMRSHPETGQAMQKALELLGDRTRSAIPGR